MSKFFVAALITAYAFAANAVIVQTPPHRSAIQEECIKDNPQDHKGYLTCIHNKKAEKKADDGKGNVTAPVNAASQPAAAATAPKAQ